MSTTAFVTVAKLRRNVGKNLIGQKIQSQESKDHYRVVGFTKRGLVAKRLKDLVVQIAPKKRRDGGIDTKFDVMTEGDFRIRVHFVSNTKVKLIA